MQVDVWMFLLLLGSVAGTPSEYLMGGHMDNNDPSKSLLEEIESSPALARTTHLDDLDLDLEAEESTVVPLNDEEGPRYRLPYTFAFNGGRPFSLEKDPITGKIDFEKAPPVKALNYTEYQGEPNEESEDFSQEEEDEQYSSSKKNIDGKEGDDVSPNEINPYSPNFHDFLNLPVHYSSNKYGKDKYPLISSSYANTKVQSGSNSYNTYNHRPYHGETVLYYPTRKPYVPKVPSTVSSTSLRTTLTTAKPMVSTTRSTTVPSTTTTTTRAPSSTSTTTTTTSTTTTTATPSTTTSSSTKAPIVTTWKPASTTKRYMEHMEDYEDILPIEKLQASMYTNDHQGPNKLHLHNRDSQTKPPMKHEEYDEYEDYELSEGEDDKAYYSVKEVTKDFLRGSTLAPTSSSVVPNITKPVNAQETTTVTTTTTTSTPPPSTTHSLPVQQENVFLGNPVQFQVLPQRPVTSMPLDSNIRDPPTFENVVDRRPSILEGGLINPGYRPNQMVNQGPNGVGGSILVESTSNIVIPPDQDTVSFVLGNRQNVEGGYYSLGTTIGENPYGGSTGIDASFHPLYGVGAGSTDKLSYDPQADRRETIALPSVAVVDSNPNYVPQKWWPPSTANAQKLVNEIEPSRPQNTFVKGTVLMDPQDERKEEKDVNFVVFPKSEKTEHPVQEHVVVVNEADGTVHEITPSSTTMKVRVDPTANNKDGLPQLSENLTPPAERPKLPPPFYHQYHHGGTLRPEFLRPQRLPLANRGKQPPPPPLSPTESLGIRRRPYAPDANLPNILPQFRPNAKTSHGHRGPETIGTIPASQSYPTRVRQPLPSHPLSRRPLPPPPSYLQRLNPPPPPIHAVRLSGAASSKAENVLPSREAESAMKRFRLPPIPATSRGDEEAKSAPSSRLSNQKFHLDEENRSERYSEEPPQIPPRPPLFPKRRTADSPHVSTLQMIQHHGEFDEETEQNSRLTMDTNMEEEDRIVTGQDADHRKSEDHETIAEAPVYVVYPVNTAVNIHPDDSKEKDESVVVGTRGPHRPLPPETLLQDNENQEMMEGGPPSIHTLFNSHPVVASDFPYPLERPDPSILTGGIRETPILVPSDQQHDDELPPKEKNEDKEDKDTSVNVIPYLQDFVPFPVRKSEAAISATLHKIPMQPSSTPIAYVYTPTVEASHRLDVDREEEHSKIDRNDQKPVLLPSQQPSSSSSSAPSPQNFMAPFVASVSVEAPAKNGWSVVVVEPSIDRKSDNEETEENSESGNTQTERTEFDAENFKPQLFGGFQPIYEFPMENEERTETGDSDTKSSSWLQDPVKSAV